MTTYTPLENKIIVKRPKRASMIGSIHIPGDAQKIPMRGTVIAVGPGKMNSKGERLPLTVKVGDVVIFEDFAGNKIEGDTWIVPEELLLGVLDET